MNIVMITPDCFMIDRRILQEAATLIQHGHKVTLLAGFECHEESHYEQDGISIHRYKYDWDDERLKKIRSYLINNDTLRIFVNRAFIFLARRFFKFTPFEYFMLNKAMKFPADIYHVHDLPCLKVGVEAGRMRNVPVVYDAHELYYAQEVLPRNLQRLYYKLEKRYIRKAGLVITVNESIAQLMAKRYEIPIPAVIMNCAELPPGFNPTYYQNVLREKSGFPENRRIVLYQGWLSAERNIEALILAAKYFSNRIGLAIIGYGAHESALKEIVTREALQDRVKFLGEIPSGEIMKYTVGADLGVIPYNPIDDNHKYCSPNKFFEYILAGVPVVTNDLPFFNTMGNTYGVVVKTNMRDPQDIAGIINKIIDSSEQLNDLKGNCRNAAQDLNWKVEGQKLLSLYDKFYINGGVQCVE